MKGQTMVSKQGVQLCSSLALTADFEAVDSEVLKKLNNDPKGTAQKFTVWLKNGGNLVLPGQRIIKIDRARTFDPAKFIGSGSTIWRGPANGTGLKGEEDQDQRALALTEINLNAVTFDNCLEEGENVVKGEVKLTRLKAKPVIRLDAAVFQTLWENKVLIPESWKEKVNGNTRFIYFDGTILRNPNGDRFVLYLYFEDGEWDWHYCWLGFDWFSYNPSAVLASN